MNRRPTPHYISKEPMLGHKECIDLIASVVPIEHYCVGNAIKYIWRLYDKDEPIKNAKKALDYLNIIIGNDSTDWGNAMIGYIEVYARDSHYISRESILRKIVAGNYKDARRRVDALIYNLERRDHLIYILSPKRLLKQDKIINGHEVAYTTIDYLKKIASGNVYVGITNKLSNRITQHKHRGGSKLNKLYSGDVFVIASSDFYSKADALSIERTLRPNPNMGFNTSVGGNASGRTDHPATKALKSMSAKLAWARRNNKNSA